MSAGERVKRERRVRTQFEALLSAGRQEGAGHLADISYTGALFAGTSIVPPVGTEIRAYVFVQPVAPFAIQGHVVRTTDDGFAIAYDKVEEEIQRFVDDAAAIVNAGPNRS